MSARLSHRGRRSTEPGVALVPARLFGDTVKSLSDAPVEFEADQAQAQIRCAAYEGALRLLPAEDFPALQPPSGTRIVVGGRRGSPRPSARWRGPPPATRRGPC